MALSREWTSEIVTGNQSRFSGLDSGERVRVRVRNIGRDGQRGRYSFESHLMEGDLAPPGPPTDAVALGFGGQIGVRFTKPSDGDYSRTLIWIAASPEELDDSRLEATQFQPVGEAVEGTWTSGIAYTGTRYYMRLRSVDAAGNLSLPTPILTLVPGPLSKSGNPILVGLDASSDSFFAWEPGTLYIRTLIPGKAEVFRRDGLPRDTRPETWVNIGIDLLAGGGKRLWNVSARPYTWNPNPINFPPSNPPSYAIEPIEDPLPTGLTVSNMDALVTDDGRVWRYIEAENRYELQGDMTAPLRVMQDSVDVDVDAECSHVYHNAENRDYKPKEGFGNHADAAFNLLGHWYRNVNEAWIRQSPDLWNENQPVEAVRRQSWPIQWADVDAVVPPTASESPFGTTWFIAVMDDDEHRGEVYRRNFKTREWERIADICGDLVVPQAPADMSVGASQTTVQEDDPAGTRVNTYNWDLQVTWFHAPVRLLPDTYEGYIENLDTQQGSGTRDVIQRFEVNGQSQIWESQRGGIFMPDGQYRCWLRGRYLQYGNTPWINGTFTITSADTVRPASPPPKVPRVVLQDAQGNAILTSTSGVIPDLPVLHPQQFQGVISPAADETKLAGTYTLHGHLRGPTVAEATPTRPKPPVTFSGVPPALNVTLDNVARVVRSAGIWELAGTARGGWPVVTTDRAIAFACIPVYEQENRPGGDDGWHEDNISATLRLREVTGTGVARDVFSFRWQHTGARSSATHIATEYVRVCGFDDTGGFYEHDLRDSFKCDEAADFTINRPSSLVVRDENNRLYSPGFWQFGRNIPAGATQNRALTIRRMPGGNFCIMLYWETLDRDQELENKIRFSGGPSFQYALCFPSLSSIEVFSPPCVTGGIPTAGSLCAYEFQWDAPEAGVPDQFEIEIRRKSDSMVMHKATVSASTRTYTTPVLTAVPHLFDIRSVQTTGIVRNSQWADSKTRSPALACNPTCAWSFTPCLAIGATPTTGGGCVVECILPPGVAVSDGADRVSKVATITQPAIGPQGTSFPWRVLDSTGTTVQNDADGNPLTGEENDLSIDILKLVNNGDTTLSLQLEVKAKATVRSVSCESDPVLTPFTVRPSDDNRVALPVVSHWWGGNEGECPFSACPGDWTFNNFKLTHGADGVIGDHFRWEIALGGRVLYTDNPVSAPASRSGTIVVTQRIRENLGLLHEFRVRSIKTGFVDRIAEPFPFVPREETILYPQSPLVSAKEDAETCTTWNFVITPQTGAGIVTPEYYDFRSGVGSASYRPLREVLPRGSTTLTLRNLNAGNNVLLFRAWGQGVASVSATSVRFTVRRNCDKCPDGSDPPCVTCPDGTPPPCVEPPPPPPPDVPLTVSLAASPDAIQTGGSSTLIWTSTGAASVSINQGIGSVDLKGTRVVAPESTTTYTATATDSDGNTATATATITVTATPPPQPLSIDLRTTRSSIVRGTGADIWWTSTGAASVSIDQGIGSVATNGIRSVFPRLTTTYTATATDADGNTASDSVTITVTDQPPPPPDPPLPPPTCCDGKELKPPVAGPSVTRKPGSDSYSNVRVSWDASPGAPDYCVARGYEVRIRGATARGPTNAGTALNQDYDDLEDGTHWAAVRPYVNCIVDGVETVEYGNWGPETQFEIGEEEDCQTRGIDAPTITAGNESAGRKTEWEFDWAAPAPRAGTVRPTHYLYEVVGPSGNTGHSGEATVTSAVIRGLEVPGSHTFRVQAVNDDNPDGEVMSCHAEFAFNVRAVNLLPPENVMFDKSGAVFASTPLLPQQAPVTSISLNWQKGSAGDDPDGYDVEVPGIVNQHVSASITTLTLRNLQREQYEGHVTATLGNIKAGPTTATVDLRVDAEACEAPSVSVSPMTGAETTRTVSISAAQTGGADHYSWTLTSASGENNDSGTSTISLINLTGLDPDEYTIAVTAHCTADDHPKSLPGEASFTVEGERAGCLKPTITGGEPSAVSLTTWQFTWSPDRQSERPTGYRYMISGAHTVTWTDHNSTSLTLANLKPGDSRLAVKQVCRDADGNELESEESDAFAFTVANPDALCRPSIDPITTIDFATDSERYNDITISWRPRRDTCEGPDPDSYSWRLEHGEDESENQSGSTSTRSHAFLNLADGDWTFYLKATKRNYNDSEEDQAEWTFTQEANKPETPVVRHQLDNNGQGATFDWDPPVSDHDYYEIRLQGSPGALQGANVVEAGTTTARATGLSVGNDYSFFVKACRRADPDPVCGEEGSTSFKAEAQGATPGPVTSLSLGELEGRGFVGQEESNLVRTALLGAGLITVAATGGYVISAAATAAALKGAIVASYLSSSASPVVFVDAGVSAVTSTVAISSGIGGGAAAAAGAGGGLAGIIGLLNGGRAKKFRVALTWDEPEEDLTADPPTGKATSYSVRSTVAGSSTSTTTDGTSMYVNLTASPGGQSITVSAEVTAINAFGESSSETVTKTYHVDGGAPATGSEPPASVTATHEGNGLIGISWTPPTDGTPTGYEIEVRRQGQTGIIPRSTAGPSQTRARASVSSAGTYTVNVYAVYGQTRSAMPASDTVTVAFRPNPPGAISESSTGQVINLTWGESLVDNRHSAAEYYQVTASDDSGSTLGSGNTSATSARITGSRNSQAGRTITVTVWAANSAGRSESPSTYTFSVGTQGEITFSPGSGSAIAPRPPLTPGEGTPVITTTITFDIP